MLDEILGFPGRAFAMTVLTRESFEKEQIVVRTWPIGQSRYVQQETSMVWPDGMYSLSHVALPFPESDPVYGGDAADASPGIHIGSLALRGEKGAIRIPAQDMLRQRWNPFYSYLEERVLERLALGGSAE